MKGSATYLTDAIDVNAAPLTVDVTLARRACESAWATLPITTRIPRRWERGKPLYFESQVERPAALAVGAKLPQGVRSMRPLGAIKLFYADGESGPSGVHREIAALLAAVRFTPPMVGGQAVNQLAQWRIERFKK